MELYPEDLTALTELMSYLPDMSKVQGVTEIEIAVRINDSVGWAVIGWGESGDPCVLGFGEKEE